MELRLLTASLLLLGSSVVAQTQDPDKPQNSPQAQLEELQREKERLGKEVGYVKERAANQKKLLAEKLLRGKPQYKSIDAGSNMPAAPVAKVAPVTPRMARVATKEELGNMPEGAAMLVNGRPVMQRALNDLAAFLAKATPAAPTDADAQTAAAEATMRGQRAAFDFLRIEAIASSFDEVQAETEDQIGQIAAALDGGKPIAEFVKAHGSVRGADADGRISVTPYSPFGPLFEQVAFTTEVGKRSRPFRTAEGLALLVVESETKGERAELDRRSCVVVQIPYTKDAAAMGAAQTAVNQGQVDVIVRDAQGLEIVPAMFKPAPAVAPTVVKPVDAELVNKQLAELSAQMAELQGKDDDDSKAKLRKLEANYAELKQSLKGAADGDQPKVIDVMIEEAPVKAAPPVKKKD
jgi:hypothetical protein